LTTNEETPRHQRKHNLIELNKGQYNILQKLFYNDWAKKRQRQGYTIPNKIQTILKKWYQEGVECSGKKWSSEKAQHVLQEGPMCFDWHAKLVVTVEKIKNTSVQNASLQKKMYKFVILHISIYIRNK
jgi:hypothetical protein